MYDNNTYVKWYGKVLELYPELIASQSCSSNKSVRIKVAYFDNLGITNKWFEMKISVLICWSNCHAVVSLPQQLNTWSDDGALRCNQSLLCGYYRHANSDARLTRLFIAFKAFNWNQVWNKCSLYVILAVLRNTMKCLIDTKQIHVVADIMDTEICC